MKNLFDKIKSLEIKPYTVPVALFVTAVCAYGIFFLQTGFYWDDLPISWIRYHLGTAATAQYFLDSRPIWAWLFQMTAYVIPQNPVYWQVFALLLRWINAVILWAIVDRLFPRRKTLALLLSLAVLVYPGFNQQWVSYVYAHFFIVLFFLLFSWLLMLRGKTIPALIFSGLNLVMFEYFFTLELARPLLVWLSLRDEPLTTRERFVRVLKKWAPYLGVLILSVLYRELVYTHPGFGYSLTAELAKAPLETLILLFQNVITSLWTVTLAAWGQVFQFPNFASDGPRTSAIYTVIVLFIFGLIYFIGQFKQGRVDERRKDDDWWLIGLGVVMLLLGGVPYWLTNIPVTLGFPANRATLSFMFGASFLLVGLIDLIPSRIKYVALIAFIALAVGRQFLWANEFRRDWQSQKTFFWQMTWRAPGLEPGTLVLTNEELLYNADNSLSAALNWIYAPDFTSGKAPYLLFYPTNRIDNSLPELKPSLPLKYDYVFDNKTAIFEGNTSQTVVFYYSPPGCLRLLDPDIDPINHLIPDDTLLREAASLSSTAPILSTPMASMPKIYGPEPPHNWCYYFEKADLARQQGDWQQVTRLGDKAFKLDDHPNDPVERFVFIEGYAHAGDWKQAWGLSLESYRVSKEYVGPLLCRLWQRIDANTPESPEKAAALQSARDKLDCTLGER
jgi:hypothetical protein